MKKIFCLTLVVLMVAALAAPAFAADKLGSKSVNPTATILGKSTKGVKIDGVVDQYEYEEIKYTADNMRYNGTDDAFLAAIQPAASFVFSFMISYMISTAMPAKR